MKQKDAIFFCIILARYSGMENKPQDPTYRIGQRRIW